MKKSLSPLVLGIPIAICAVTHYLDVAREKREKRMLEVKAECDEFNARSRQYSRENELLSQEYGNRFVWYGARELKEKGIASDVAKAYDARFGLSDIEAFWDNKRANAAEDSNGRILPEVANAYVEPLDRFIITQLFNKNISAERVKPYAPLYRRIWGSDERFFALIEKKVDPEYINSIMQLAVKYRFGVSFDNLIFYSENKVSLEEIEKAARQKAIENSVDPKR